MARPSATVGAPAVSGKGGRQGGPGEPSSLERALGASLDSVTCRLCDLGELTSPLCALGSLPEKMWVTNSARRGCHKDVTKLRVWRCFVNHGAFNK